MEKYVYIYNYDVREELQPLFKVFAKLSEQIVFYFVLKISKQSQTIVNKNPANTPSDNYCFKDSCR